MTHEFARWVSRIGHPFVLPLVTLLLITLRLLPLPQALAIVAIAAFTVTIPTLVYTHRQIQRHRWSDYDVSVRRDRYRLYPVLLAVQLGSLLVFWLLGAPVWMLRGVIGGLALTFVAMLANFVIKISLHAALATLCAVVLLALNAWIGGAAVVFAGLIGWSRVVLRRHTLLEVISGTVLGVVVGGALLLSA